MSITITGATGTQRHLKKVGKVIELSPKRMVKIASEARNRIVERSNKGLNASDGAFKPLDPDYAEYKISKKKQGIPNLHWSGAMMKAMTVKKISGGAMIYFNDEKERKKATGHHFGFGKAPRRSFFRLGKKIEKYIFSEFRKPIKKAL